jgi:asparagine synthase (glutamine-hydrolysing)
MCGFYGFIDRRGQTFLEEASHAMGGTLHHRGPDDAGVWVDGDRGVCLGHRRLSILDLSPEGHQPMHSGSGRYVVAYNGEIYNFAELRRELAGRGAAFRGHSDTEVLLAAVDAWGVPGALRRFVGMFAFALWDRKEEVLYLARDRMGEKPLYYGWSGGVFLFGSELKALRAHPRWRGEVDTGALALYVRHSAVPAPYSIYGGVKKLVPGTWLAMRRDAPRRACPTPWCTGHPEKWSLPDAGIRSPAASGRRSTGWTRCCGTSSAIRWSPTCHWAPFSPGGWTRPPWLR